MFHNSFLDNNRNWRDPKEPEPGETPKKTWNRTNSTSEHPHSNLPEWCNDDEDISGSIPGSFDASGQFRSFKVSLIVVIKEVFSLHIPSTFQNVA